MLLAEYFKKSKQKYVLFHEDSPRTYVDYFIVVSDGSQPLFPCLWQKKQMNNKTCKHMQLPWELQVLNW